MFNIFNKVKKEKNESKNNNIIKENKPHVLNFDDFLQINNEKLNKILNYINDESVFFKEDARLISKSEIENFEKECQCNINGMIPLIDVFNNDFIVYICDSDLFGMYNIVDELLFDKNYKIDEVIAQLDDYYRKL